MPARLLSLLEPTQDEKQWGSHGSLRAILLLPPTVTTAAVPSSRPKHFEVQRELAAAIAPFLLPEGARAADLSCCGWLGFAFPLSPPRAAVLAWRGPRIWVIAVRTSGSFRELQALLIQKKWQQEWLLVSNILINGHFFNLNLCLSVGLYHAASAEFSCQGVSDFITTSS